MSTIDTFDVDTALALRTFGKPTWNHDGSYIGFEVFADGTTSFIARPVAELASQPVDEPSLADVPTFTLAEEVSDQAWRPAHPAELALIQSGDIVLADVERDDVRPIARAEASHSSLAWAPDGRQLAYIRDGAIWVFEPSTGATVQCPTAAAELFGDTPLEWSASGRYLAALTMEHGTQLGLSVFDLTADTEVTVAFERRPDPTAELVVDAFEWVGDWLVFTEDAVDGTQRKYRAVDMSDPTAGTGSRICTEYDRRGLATPTMVGHESGLLAIIAEPDGYQHVYVCSLEDRLDATLSPADLDFRGPGLTQVTAGAFEARGDALDEPAWDSAGRRLAIVTNEHDYGRRQLTIAEIADGEVRTRQSIDVEGASVVYPTWSNGKIAYLRAGSTTPAEVRWIDLEGTQRGTASVAHPAGATLRGLPAPEAIEFESSADGSTVYGYLYQHPNADADPPAVVWAHGGPVRQMREGFHHMRSYAYFHLFNYLLVARGYAVLSLNYRGGIGYGRDYRLGIYHQIGDIDVADCEDAARYLRNREDLGDRIGFWGLSYGGFLANAVAVKTDSYDCSVNFAGIWDWRDWLDYASDRYRGAARRFIPLFGGLPDDTDEDIQHRLRHGSPCSHLKERSTPLFGLHGTDDPNVPINQLDRLISDLVAARAPFEMAYYPEEDHMFEDPDTWRDALDRVMPFFDTHLRE